MTLPLPQQTGQTDTERHPSFVDRTRIHPVLFAFLSLVIIFILYQVVGGVVTFFLMHGTSITRDNVNVLRLFTMLGQILLIFLPTVLLGRLLSSNWRAVFPIRMPTVKESVAAVIGLLSLQRVFEVYIFLQDKIPIPDFFEKLIEPLRRMLEEMVRALLQSDSVHEFAFVILVVAFVPAIVEELLFRGLVQSSFNRGMRPLASVFLTGAIFGLFHLNPFEVVPLIGIGCFLAFVRYRSASVLLPICLHFLNNLLAVIAASLNMGDEKIIMAPTTDQPSILIVLVQLILFGALFVASNSFYLRATDRFREPAE